MTEPRPYTPMEAAIANPIIRVMSLLNTWAYRATGGRLGGTFLRGAPVLLMTVVGRKTGRRLTVPLLYLRDDERLVIVASKGGMDQHPLWYLNLLANPEVDVQVGNDVRPMRAARRRPTPSASASGRGWSRCIATTRTTRRARRGRSPS